MIGMPKKGASVATGSEATAASSSVSRRLKERANGRRNEAPRSQLSEGDAGRVVASVFALLLPRGTATSGLAAESNIGRDA
jgi:hypothetical protein